jgi:hypothetical protein
MGTTFPVADCLVIQKEQKHIIASAECRALVRLMCVVSRETWAKRSVSGRAGKGNKIRMCPPTMQSWRPNRYPRLSASASASGPYLNRCKQPPPPFIQLRAHSLPALSKALASVDISNLHHRPQRGGPLPSLMAFLKEL